MSRSRDALSSRRPLPLWIPVLAAVLGFAAWDALGRSRHVLEVSARYGVAVDAPKEDADSPTGYAQGRRSLLLPAADTAHWEMQTQAMIAEGAWRIRRVSYDNAPEGRDVHWAAPLHWWLAGLAWLDHQLSDRPIGVSVEYATLTAGPVMLGVILLGLTPLLVRKFSAAAAGITGPAVRVAYSTETPMGRSESW